MEDSAIIQMYWERNDEAIRVTSEKYGRYCRTIAKNILSRDEDAEECLNDTYLSAWNAMPEHWPEQLATFLGKLTRNLAFNRYKHDRARKRGGGEIVLVLEELADCVSDTDSVEQAIDRKELISAINTFVNDLSAEKRTMFVRRYWYADSVSQIAKGCGVMQGTVSKTLERIRKQLRIYLTERGFTL